MLSLTERPEPWSFSRNYIRYRFQAGNLGTQSVTVQVRLWMGDVAGSNDVMIASRSLAPDSTGLCEIYLEDLIDANLQWQLPQPAAGTVTPVTAHTASFFIEYRESTALNSSPAWVSDVAARCRAIKGGLPEQLYNRSLPAQLSYFSYQQSFVARVGITDHFYRTFVSLASLQPSGRTAQISLLFSDNTTQTATLAIGTGGNVYHVPASPAAWGLVSPASKVPVSYQVQVVETTGTATTTTILQQAEIDHNWYRQVQCLQYHNSLGGLDFVRLLGDTDIELERTFTDGEAIGTANYNQPYKVGRYFQQNLQLVRTHKGDAGYQESPAEQEALQELDLSQSVWGLRPLSATVQQWQAVRILNKGRKLRTVGSAGTKRWNYEVEWQWAYNITAYSSLPYTGLGADTNTYAAAVCGIVSGLAVTTTPYPQYSATYVAWSWVAGSNNWQYTLEFRQAGAALWEAPVIIYTNSLSLALLPNQTFEWRVRALCSITDASPWVNGPNFTT